jgi:hypothetical protein
MTNQEQLEAIATRILDLVSTDNDGQRWGHDTNCGPTAEVLAEAVGILKESIATDITGVDCDAIQCTDINGNPFLPAEAATDVRTR